MEASTPSSSITPSKLPCIYQLGSSRNPVLWGFYGEFLTLAWLIQSLDISNGLSPPWGQEDRTKSLNPLITGLVPLATCLHPEVTQGLSKTHHINITKDILLLSTPKSLTKIKYIFIINQCHTSWMLLSLIVSEKKKKKQQVYDLPMGLTREWWTQKDLYTEVQQSHVAQTEVSGSCKALWKHGWGFCTPRASPKEFSGNSLCNLNLRGFTKEKLPL